MGEFNAYHNQHKNDMDKFEKGFYRTKMFVWVIIVCQILLVITLFIFMALGIAWGVNKINQKGLKGCVERIWNGDTNKTFAFPPPDAVQSKDNL